MDAPRSGTPLRAFLDAREFGILERMGSRLREGLGGVLVVCALVALWLALDALKDQHFVATLLLLTTGLSILRAGVELLRPSVGE